MCASDGDRRSLSTFFSLTAYKLETTQTFSRLAVPLVGFCGGGAVLFLFLFLSLYICEFLRYPWTFFTLIPFTQTGMAHRQSGIF